jgi:hypothetical protein
VAIPFRQSLERWAGTRADDDLMRALFGIILTATAAVLVLDYSALSEAAVSQATPAPAVTPDGVPGIVPAGVPMAPDDGRHPRAPLWQPDPQLKSPMSFDLQSGGRLLAVGTITPGTAKTFAAEIDKRGDYVKTVVLHSPGGSLEDALAIGRLIRARKFSTEVQGGHYCASACPLVFAAGIERKAGAKSGIGVHRVVVVAGSRDGVADGQRVSARAQKYLRDMGVDPAVWIHAMETPNERLYRFNTEELLSLKLATQAGDRRPAEAKAKS